MNKERLVGVQLTNGNECICNPTVLLGTHQGLWDIQNEKVPAGVLFDLNAAWELFLSRSKFLNISFNIVEHHQHEVIDGVVYEEGDVTYTLKDNDGNPTGATFTLRQNTNPIQHMATQDGKLYLYYSKIRVIEDSDEGNPIYYVRDNEGNIVIDEETQKPLIYDYVSISIIEIFDNDETKKLFPWYADENNVVKLRPTLNDNELGEVKITPDSEVYVKDHFTEELTSVQSVYDQLQTDLGFKQILQDGRAQGSTLSDNLHEYFIHRSSIVGALNETLLKSEDNLQSIQGLNEILYFADQIRNNAFSDSNVPNLLDAINWIQEHEIGTISSDEYETIAEALQIVFNKLKEFDLHVISGHEVGGEIYNPNPHNVKADQLFIIVNDPNDEDNLRVDDPFYKEYDVDSAIQKLFDRINVEEDTFGKLANAIGTAEDMQQLDLLDEVVDGNPTLISLAIENKSRIDYILPIPNDVIDSIII